MNDAARPRRRLAVLLAGIAGSVDALGYLTLFHLFTAHMTGNTVASATHAGLHEVGEAVRRAFVIPVFVFGVATGAVLRRALTPRTRATFVAPLAIEALAIVALIVLRTHVDVGTDEHHLRAAYFFVAALPAFAMGVQSATLRRVADHGVRTTFVTGMLTSLGEQVVQWLASVRVRNAHAAAVARARSGLLATIWLAYFGGAVVTTLIEPKVGARAGIGAVAVLVIAIALDLRGARSRADEELARA